MTPFFTFLPSFERTDSYFSASAATRLSFIPTDKKRRGRGEERRDWEKEGIEREKERENREGEEREKREKQKRDREGEPKRRNMKEEREQPLGEYGTVYQPICRLI